MSDFDCRTEPIENLLCNGTQVVFRMERPSGSLYWVSVDDQGWQGAFITTATGTCHQEDLRITKKPQKRYRVCDYKTLVARCDVVDLEPRTGTVSLRHRNSYYSFQPTMLCMCGDLMPPDFSPGDEHWGHVVDAWMVEEADND